MYVRVRDVHVHQSSERERPWWRSIESERRRELN